jgi:hypothetical protein
MGDNVVTVRQRAEQVLSEMAGKNSRELRCSCCLSMLKSCVDSLGGIIVWPCQKCASKSAVEKIDSGTVFRWLTADEEIFAGDLCVYDGDIVPTDDVGEAYNTTDHWPTCRPVDISDIRKSVMADVAALKKIISGMQI